MEQVKAKFRRLLFLHRVAFICNIFFLVCMVLRYSHAEKVVPQPVVELSAILGWIFSPAVNLVCLVVSLILVLKKGKGLYVPVWLIASNLVFFTFEIFYFFLT